jgi:hypothetical protein
MPPEDSAEAVSEELPDVLDPGGEAEPDSQATASESPEAQTQQDVWGSFRQLPQFQGVSDEEIASRLQETMRREQQASRALQQYQSIIPAASEYLSNRPMYEQWKQSQAASSRQPQAAQQPQQQEEPAWWNPPKVKDIYRQYLTRDQQGREVIADGAPLEAQHELAAYQAYKAEFARKFLDDPQATLGPMIEKIVASRAQEIAESQISGLKEESLVQQIEAENRDWLYDEQGRVSREGLLVQKYIEDARGLGISGAKARWDYATAMVERELALANLQTAMQPPAPQQDTAQRNMEFLRQQASRAPARRANPTTDSRVPQKPMSFADRMYSNLQGME